MLVVSDNTAITTLLKVGQVQLLQQLFTRLVIPAAVAEELLRFHPSLPDFCEVRVVATSPRLQRLLAQADIGEAHAISLAVQLSAEALLIDDSLPVLRAAHRYGIGQLLAVRNPDSKLPMVQHWYKWPTQKAQALEDVALWIE